MPDLPAGFLDRPFAHRALHGPGIPENSPAAMRAAVEAGYGIEIDLQCSADGVAMVFHDASLSRLTAQSGLVRALTAAELASIHLMGGEEGIPTLDEVLESIDGRVPLLIELKDQTGALAEVDGALEGSVARSLAGYDGPAAVMGFNPESIAYLRDAAPDVPRGLTTDAFSPLSWPRVPRARLRALFEFADLSRVGASFISHDYRDISRPQVRELADQGLPVVTWTVRSVEEEQVARDAGACQITFEGYVPA